MRKGENKEFSHSRAGLDLDVRCLALRAAEGLVDHDARVRQAAALPRGPGAEEEGAHGPWLKGSVSNLTLIFQPNEQTL